MPPRCGDQSRRRFRAKTALFITHDENGGFFDHVPPRTAPAGTSGEYLTVNPLPRTRRAWPDRSGLGSGCRC
jgi:phospholipase C